MTRPLNALIALEFTIPCEQCDQPARWYATATHGCDHLPAEELLCDYCLSRSRQSWEGCLGETCECGMPFSDSLNDQFRAIEM